MAAELEQYFVPNQEAAYRTDQGRLHLQSIDWPGNRRVPKAYQQAGAEAVSVPRVMAYGSEFLDRLCGGAAEPNGSPLWLDGREQEIVGRCVLARGCAWKPPVYDAKRRRYTFHDHKYDAIQAYFGLNDPRDIVWLKFTRDGFLGVVADSFDINFCDDSTSGRLLRCVGKMWDSRFVVIFPISPAVMARCGHTRREIETGIGNYLAAKGVPIIDFYSHQNF